ncbi:MAG: holo-ACP synthase [Alphaproteobacteria bacterium]|nr:holo-ACP synthase [Alphaproteobacteria bacterium]
MIVGIGTDIVQIRRIELSIRRWGDKFLNRIFTETERKTAEKLSAEPRMAYYAKRFAAKEAFSKALGTGIGSLSAWTEIEVVRGESGAPILNITGRTAETLKQRAGSNAKVHISLSDDDAATAFVIIENNK